MMDMKGVPAMKTLHSKPHIASSTSEESKRRIYMFLAHQPIGTLSTVDPNGDPHGAVIYYSIDKDFNITFTTKRKTKKFDNLSFHNHAMLVVFEAMSQTTVQITGTVEEITDTDESDSAFRSMLANSMATSEAGLPPITKLQAGTYVALRLKPLQIRMAVFARPDPGGYDMYESIEFDV
jgi:pyridoxine/pyridoxamine 5'-phosphate oxidase